MSSAFGVDFAFRSVTMDVHLQYLLRSFFRLVCVGEGVCLWFVVGTRAAVVVTSNVQMTPALSTLRAPTLQNFKL